MLSLGGGMQAKAVVVVDLVIFPSLGGILPKGSVL